MSPRVVTATMAIVGSLVLAAGALTFVLGSSRADEAATEVVAATDAELASRQEEVAGEDLDRRIRAALVDVHQFAMPLDPALRRALEDSRTHRQRLEAIVANAERSVAAMRADDGAGYNATLDRHDELNEQRVELWRTVNESTGEVSQHLAQVYAAYDEALRAPDR